MNLNVLVQAKHEYTKQICSLLKNHIYDYFKKVYNKYIEQFRYNKGFIPFQTELKDTRNWSQLKIDEIINSLDGIEYLDKLLAAVFISSTKILSAVQLHNNGHKIKLNIPKIHIFIHKCFIEVSNELYKDPYLMYHKCNNEKQKSNYKKCIILIENCIDETIRKILPIQDLLREFIPMDDPFTEEVLSMMSESDGGDSEIVLEEKEFKPEMEEIIKKEEIPESPKEISYNYQDVVVTQNEPSEQDSISVLNRDILQINDDTETIIPIDNEPVTKLISLSENNDNYIDSWLKEQDGMMEGKLGELHSYASSDNDSIVSMD
jgi:hypothetical protein